MAGDAVTALCGSFCLISAFILFIMILLSFSSLDYNEYGLDYSSITKTVKNCYKNILKISPRPLEAGVHFLGIGHSFIRFSKTVQTVEFSDDKTADGPSLHSRTSDGLEVVLEISFQYLYDFSSLLEIYAKFKDKHSHILKNMAVDVLSETANRYSAYDFFMDRQTIGIAMQDALNKFFQENCYSQSQHANKTLNRSVDLPDQFEDAIQQSEVKKQEIQKALAEKNRTIVELETKQMSALYALNVTLNQAQGKASVIEADGQAKADSFIVLQSAAQQGLFKLKETLELDNEHLIDYLKSKIIRDYNGNDLFVFLKDE